MGLQSLDGGDRRCESSRSHPLLPAALWYCGQTENPTFFLLFSEELLKYSAEEDGDSSGVSSSGLLPNAPGKVVSLGCLPEVSLGGVGGLTVKGAEYEAMGTIVLSTFTPIGLEVWALSRVLLVEKAGSAWAFTQNVMRQKNANALSRHKSYLPY